MKRKLPRQKPLNHDRQKIILLCAAACFIAAGYSILRPFKVSIFFQLVGKEYYPLSKILMIFAAIPIVAWYSKLVDFFKQHTVLYLCFAAYFVIGLLLASSFLHPSWGLSNSTAHPYRILGWIYSLSMDFYPTFVIGTFWAFVNSISTPSFAKKGYALIYAFIKIGSIIATGTGFFFLSQTTNNTTLIPVLIAIASLLTLSSLFFIAILIRKIPEKERLGYLGKKRGAASKKNKPVLGMLEGIKFLITKPYVFGMFLLFFFYNMIFIIVEYQATIMLSIHTNNSANQMSSMLFLSATITNSIGLLLALLVTPFLLRKIRLAHTLLLMPAIVVITLITMVLFPNIYVMVGAMTLLPAIHYSVYSPAREMLFIPTIKEIQFKSKAWIDSFGRSFAKSSGSTFNMLFFQVSQSYFLAITALFSFFIAALWATIAYSMGKSYEKTVDKNDIIGSS